MSNRVLNLRHFLALYVVAMLAVTVRPSDAASADDQKTCFQAEGRKEFVSACTRVMESGKPQGQQLAPVYLSRGLAWSRMNNPERAIQDYSEAIKLDPQFAPALNNRCAVYVRENEFDLAIRRITSSSILPAR
jgi:tetratricopeptide (TPR) repeat protein